VVENRDLLRATIADFFEVDPGQVGAGFPLTGRLGQGSIARAALDSAIRRRVGLKSAVVYSARTYGELETALLGKAPDGLPSPASAGELPAFPVDPATNGSAARVASASASAAVPAAGAGLLVSCGVDIELVENLPPATDYWEHEFYTTVFTPKEIAYCLMQESPPIHFAGRWCAKEALKKCDPELLAEEMRNIEFVSGESRGPYLCRYVGGEARRLPHAVSIAHTPQAAIAIVVKWNGSAAVEARGLEGPPAVFPASSGPVAAPAPAPPPHALEVSRGRPGLWIGLVALAALALAVLALLRTFRF
jgi:phosphopantetheine--protein transferase-like protein